MLLALGGFLSTAGFSSRELSRWGVSERGVRRRRRLLGGGRTGSPSEEVVSAGPGSDGDSTSEGPLVSGVTELDPFTPFTTTAGEDTEQPFYQPQSTLKVPYYAVIHHYYMV